MFSFKSKRLSLALVKHRLRLLRFALPAFLLLSFLGVMTLPNDSAEIAKGQTSPTPRFNFLQGDYQMLEVAKATDTTWSDPLNANIGDRVVFLLYYHNGIVGSTAHNTKARVDLPLNQTNQIVAKSWLWSDETEPISDTIVNGQIVGPSGATINLPSNGRIEYVAGSTSWYPNGTSTPTHIPDGIVSDGGINIGSIEGCWQFSGFLSFAADIKGPAQLVMDKNVAHPGDTTWAKEISAHPGDSVAYKLGIRNDGGTPATQVSVKDRLPTNMTYTPGTTFLYTKDHPEGIRQSDTLFTGGLVIPDISPEQSNVVYLTYKTKINVNMPAGSFILNNVAQVFMGGVEQDQDQAKVNVTAERGLTLDKKVSNGTSWVEQSTAKLGDAISYRIVITNTGNTPIDNVVVRDALPVFVDYTPGSTRVDGAVAGDEIVSSTGLSLGTIASGGTKTITLSGIIVGCAPIGSSNLVNTAFIKGEGVVELSDSAVTVVTISAPSLPKVN